MKKTFKVKPQSRVVASEGALSGQDTVRIRRIRNNLRSLYDDICELPDSLIDDMELSDLLDEVEYCLRAGTKYDN